MSHAYQIHKQDAVYFMTLTAVEWLDIFIRNDYKQIICDSLNFCIEQKGLEIFCYVIMSSHLHLIARAKNNNLSGVMRDFKKYTSGMLIEEIRLGHESRKSWMLKIIEQGGEKQKIKSSHQLWQYNNHAEEIYSPKLTLSKIKYIHNNPVEEGYVQYPEQYYYSSARDYAGLNGPVKVSVLNLHNLHYS
jgi:putative transposase